MRPCRLFLFDLDGTLIDSRDDIARSCNRALARLGLPAIPLDLVTRFVGEGVRTLITRALREAAGGEPADEEVARAVALYLAEYEAHMLDSTRLYPGVVEALDQMRWASFGVVTNKPERFSRSILDQLGVGGRFSLILGGDSLPQRKPDPAPIRVAMARAGAQAAETAVVGDSATDIEAGRAAGAFTCGIAGGFRGPEELRAAGCDLLVESVADLPAHFQPPA